jgi:hypothetical protein
MLCSFNIFAQRVIFMKLGVKYEKLEDAQTNAYALLHSYKILYNISWKYNKQHLFMQF